MKALCIVISLVLSTTTVYAESATHYIKQAAREHRVSESFALRIAKIESGHKCHVVGQRGEVGPLQILPSTARSLGYKNIRSASCRTKVSAGMKYLARCYHKARGNWGRAAACHNAGEGSLRWKRYPASVRKYIAKVTR